MKVLESIAPGDADYALALALDPRKLPSHIAIIMDGNGRWAKRRGLPRVSGHRAGVKAVRNIVEVCAQTGVKALTLYAFSAENWKRPRFEIEMLWRLLRFYLRHEMDDLQRNDIRLQSSGRIEQLPAVVYEELRAAERATARNRGMVLNLAINYSARNEIVDAVNALIDKARLENTLGNLVIDEAMVSNQLYTAGLPEPDLLIRTSGEMRISNFLLWQIAYAELYVTETLWPDFNRTELLRALLDYQKRERRFGGIGETAEVVELAAPESDLEEIAVSLT